MAKTTTKKDVFLDEDGIDRTDKRLDKQFERGLEDLKAGRYKRIR